MLRDGTSAARSRVERSVGWGTWIQNQGCPGQSREFGQAQLSPKGPNPAITTRPRNGALTLRARDHRGNRACCNSMWNADDSLLPLEPPFDRVFYLADMPSNATRSLPPAFAALDLGTNNCRLLVGAPAGDGFRVLDSFSRIVRLGEGLHHTGRLSQTAMDRAIAALHGCAARLARRPVQGGARHRHRSLPPGGQRRRVPGPRATRNRIADRRDLEPRGGRTGAGKLRAVAARRRPAGAVVRYRRRLN